MSVATEIAGARPISRAIRRRQVTALLIYVGFVAALISAAAAMLFDLANEHAALEESQNALARLEQQAPSHESAAAEIGASPFLTGATFTIAGAVLQARVEAAAKKAGAKILSSQIDLQGPRGAEGFVNLSDRLEIHQPDLQGLLYDLEAGAPYLFIDSLEIESPSAFGEDEKAWMRVEMGVTGQWRDAP